MTEATLHLQKFLSAKIMLGQKTTSPLYAAQPLITADTSLRFYTCSVNNVIGLCHPHCIATE
jgi:hypothetical protein